MDLSLDYRRKLAAMSISLRFDTPLAPKPYEQELLAQYQHGKLTLSEVLHRLDTSTYHLLYYGEVTQMPTPSMLRNQLKRARVYNIEHDITGVLLHDAEQFVHLLEGSKVAVTALFALIKEDLKHIQVLTLHHGPGPNRRFPDWPMMFAAVDGKQLATTVAAICNPQPQLILMDDPRLATLLQTAGITTIGGGSKARKGAS